ncbi:MAG: DsrE/DsrF/DrsH-like family protein [Dehalococcoidales bacterium]|nr:DsrE/DsrF/DrsH-like family protein [Dehalococcoidales bacterium]
MARKASIILNSDDLDKACAAFTIANASAAAGMDVTVFFTCWGVNVVRRKGLLFDGDNLMNRMMSFLNRDGAEKLKLSKFNFFGFGSWMMRRMMKAKNIQSIPELMADARELGVKFLVCDNPTVIFGLKRGDLIDEVDDIVGAATYVHESAGAELTLFI